MHALAMVAREDPVMFAPACSLGSFGLDIIFSDHCTPGPHLHRQKLAQAIRAADIEPDMEGFGQSLMHRRVAQRLSQCPGEAVADLLRQTGWTETAPPGQRL